MAENELEVRLNKKITQLQAQINMLGAYFKRLHGQMTHPSVLARVKEYQKTISGGDILGTVNQVNVANGTDSLSKQSDVTLSLPQDIDITATPIFAGISPNTDADVLGTVLKRWNLLAYDATINGVLDWSTSPSKPKIYSQVAEPDIPNNTIAIWENTSSSMVYVLIDIGGTQYKTEFGVVSHGSVYNVVSAVISTFVSSSTYYLGSKAGLEPQTVATYAPLYITKSGVLDTAYIHWQDNVYGGGIAGSNENVSVYIRLNNTTDTLIATISNVNSAKLFSNTGLTISVAQGDYIEIKLVTPAWVTSPVDIAVGGVLYIQET